MITTLQELSDIAYRLKKEGAYTEALKAFRLVLEAVPLDFDLRLNIGDLLAVMGQTKAALMVYKSAAEHDIKAGNPLRAMVAAKILAQYGVDISAVVSLMVEKYSAGSSYIGRSIKLAPSDYSVKVREGIDVNYPVSDLNAFIAETALMAADISTIRNYPALVPPLPIFSTLDKASFEELFLNLELCRHSEGELVVEQGKPGDALFFIAGGEVKVLRADSNGQIVQLARLGAGALFGEMALLSADPRSASVLCDSDVNVLMLKRDNVERLGTKIPMIAAAMARFMRERLINNLLSTNPLFCPFDDTAKKQLLSRFTGHDVPAGTVFLEEGDIGRGLYVILSGKSKVTKKEGDETLHLADIGPGDIVGEMALLNEAPVSATVCTKTPSTLLFLARELFLPLIEAVPALKSYFVDLANNRQFDTQAKAMAEALIKQAAAEQESPDFSIDEDEIVFI